MDQHGDYRLFVSRGALLSRKGRPAPPTHLDVRVCVAGSVRKKGARRLWHRPLAMRRKRTGEMRLRKAEQDSRPRNKSRAFEQRKSPSVSLRPVNSRCGCEAWS